MEFYINKTSSEITIEVAASSMVGIIQFNKRYTTQFIMMIPTIIIINNNNNHIFALQVYNSSYCNYKKNSYLTTSLNNRTSKTLLITTLFNSSDCTNLLCTIQGKIPQVLLSDPSILIIEAVNEFTRSVPSSYHISSRKPLLLIIHISFALVAVKEKIRWQNVPMISLLGERRS